MKRTKDKFTLMGRILPALAWVSLLGALMYHFSQGGFQKLGSVRGFFPEDTVFEQISGQPEVFKIIRRNAPNALPVYLAFGRGDGYGGPLQIALETDSGGTIQRILVLEQRETQAFWDRLTDNHFLDQFKGKSARASFALKHDVDGVSGATVSSLALTKAIRTASHGVAVKGLGQAPEPFQYDKKTILGIHEVLLTAIFGLVLAGTLLRWRWMRYITLVASLVFLGFHLNACLSLSTLASVMLGYIPSFSEKGFWWLLVFGSIILNAVLGKSVYCYWMCPFGCVQETAGRIGGFHVRPHKKSIRMFGWIKKILLWLSLIMIFLSGNPSITGFEPFALLFGLQGSGIQWFLLPVVIFGSLLFHRFWCRIFCPVGAIMDAIARFGRAGRKRIRGRLSLGYSKKIGGDI